MVKITLFGLAGTGTSTIGKLYASQNDFEFISSGNLFRKEAKKRNLSLIQLNELAQNDESLDKNLDKLIAEIGLKKDNIIVDSRLAWHFIPDSMKVKLECCDITRIERISKREGGYLSDIFSKTKEREYLEMQRYNQYYNILDYTHDSNFDYIIDTTNLNPNQITNKIKLFLKN